LDGLPLAGFGQRAIGFVLDFVVVMMLWLPLELFWARFISRGEGIGVLQFFWSPNRMCVHDRIAETIVLNVRPSASRLAGIDDGDSDHLIELVEGL
jgi:hypothetical protein